MAGICGMKLKAKSIWDMEDNKLLKHRSTVEEALKETQIGTENQHDYLLSSVVDFELTLARRCIISMESYIAVLNSIINVQVSGGRMLNRKAV